MARLSLTEQKNPLAQTFRVTESVGSVLTGVGLFFYSTPGASDAQKPITVELRPVRDGAPSSDEYWPGTRVTVAPSVIRSKASTTFSTATEHKFTFKQPIYVPGNTEVAIVAYTSAKVGQWQVWVGEVGELVSGNTTKRITGQLDTGTMYESSNGTAWQPSQMIDLAFRVYRAVFNYRNSFAYLDITPPPLRALTQNTKDNLPHNYPRNPLIFKANSPRVKVLHPNHGFSRGDQVYLTGFDSASSTRGVLGSNIMGTRTIDSADAFGYSFRASNNDLASSTGQGGGNRIKASEQIVSGNYAIISNIPRPTGTSASAKVKFTTTVNRFGQEHTTAADNTPWQPTQELSAVLNQFVQLREPFVIATDPQEQAATKLNGASSGYIKINLTTKNKYVAPCIYPENTKLRTVSWLIDDQQSDDSDATNKTYMTTLPYVSEQNPIGGTTASKHITIPYSIAESATSIRVLMDMYRVEGTDINVWYRTTNTDGTPINKISWKPFSKTNNPPNFSNYYDQIPGPAFKQYEFNVYDISEFDQYQIKITFHSRNVAYAPTIRNLRTIATI